MPPKTKNYPYQETNQETTPKDPGKKMTLLQEYYLLNLEKPKAS
jgi:hypothetical protein